MSGHCPCMTLSCHLTTGFPPSCPFHVSHDVLVLSLPCRSIPPSGPRHFLGMSASCAMYVPFFRCESFAFISRRADWFPCALFPFPSPCTPLVFISVPCMSLSVPLCFPFMSRCFPVMSTSYFLPSFPCTSSHFPFCSPIFPAKNHGFSSVFAIRTSKTQSFSRFPAKGGRNPKPAKSRQGESSLGPLFCDTGSAKTTFSGNCRAVPPRRIRRRAGEGLGGGLSSILS